ncbi:MAG: hypothetical protein GX913_03845 [Clostridiales bacterium]|nr:hypothetical protein [Clostridiales bacterium]
MGNLEDWKSFEQSGKVSDYLLYKDKGKSDYTNDITSTSNSRRMGEEVYGRFDQDNGHGVICHASWRI